MWSPYILTHIGKEAEPVKVLRFRRHLPIKELRHRELVSRRTFASRALKVRLVEPLVERLIGLKFAKQDGDPFPRLANVSLLCLTGTQDSQKAAGRWSMPSCLF